MLPLNISERVDAAFPFTSPLWVTADPSDPVMMAVWVDCAEPETVDWVALKVPSVIVERVSEKVPDASLDPVSAAPESPLITTIPDAWA
jgi:hypothetical protein